MKRILLVIFALISLNTFAQLQVKEGSFKYVPGGVIDNKLEYTDGNDLPMALIKISTENIPEQERLRLVFVGNRATQIIKKPKTGSMWIYISAEAATFIDIRHPDYGTYKYYLPEELCDYCVYEMILQYKNPNAYAGPEKPNINYLIISSDREDAEIYIDDEYVGDKEVSKTLNIGTTHTWRMECKYYHTESGSVEITEGDPIVVEKKMRPAYGYIEVESTPENGALVYIDNERVGKTPFKTDKLESGEYVVKVVKEMYKQAEQKFTVVDGQTTKAVLNMEPNFVKVTINTDSEADIYINNELKAKGSWTGRLAEGSHYVEARKAQHETTSKNINVVLGEDMVINIDAPRAICGFLNVNTEPMRAEIYIDGKHYGQTPKIITDLLVGVHELVLNKQGYAELKKTITITEGETLSLKETLVPGKSNSSVKNESVTKTVQTPKPQQPKTETAKTVKQNVTKPKVDDKFGFVTLNAAYSVAPQLSYGISFGSVKKVGWYLSAMSNFDFTGLNVIDKPFDEVAVTGYSTTTRLSATAGLVVQMAKPVYLKLGAGYGMRIRAAETLNGQYVKYPANTYEGIEATAGVMFRLGGLAISLDAVTTNFQMMEMKVGLGFGW
jgi:hypothetical protein